MSFFSLGNPDKIVVCQDASCSTLVFSYATISLNMNCHFHIYEIIIVHRSIKKAFMQIELCDLFFRNKCR
jgi:hypothetical protein